MPNIYHSKLMSIFSACLFILAGCGGGGGSDNKPPNSEGSQTQNTQTPPGTSTAATNITVDNSVPRTAAQKVSSFSSVAGTASVGNQLDMPVAQPNVDYLVLGNNGSEPLLMGFTSGAINLSSDTTAVALVRIALGAIRPTDIKVSEIDSLIKATSSYTALVTQINTQLSSGNPPQKSAQVVKTVWDVTNQTIESLKNFKSTISKSATQLKAETNVAQLLPYDIINFGVRDKIWIEDDIGNNINLKNRTAIVWAGFYTLEDGQTETRLIEGRQETYGQLLSAYSDSESTTVFTVPADKFTFTVSQKRSASVDPVSVNGMRATQRLVGLVLSNVPNLDAVGTQCALNVGSAVFNQKLPLLLTQESAGSAWDYVATGLGLSNPLDFATFLFNSYVGCNKNAAINKAIIESYFPKLIGVIKELYVARDLVNTADMIHQYYKYTALSTSQVVCQSTSTTPGAKADCGESGFYIGTANIEKCSYPGVFYCNFLTYNLGVYETAALAFRIGNEPLNVRLDQKFGCIGATASVVPQAGTSFTYSLSSSKPLVTPSTTEFRVDFADGNTMEGGIIVKYQVTQNGQTVDSIATGTWKARKATQAFPKCLLPIRTTGVPAGGDAPVFFCSNYGGSANYWGCDFRAVGTPARKDEWVKLPSIQ